MNVYGVNINYETITTLEDDIQILCLSKITNKYSCQSVRTILKDEHFSDDKFYFFLICKEGLNGRI